MCDSNVVLDKGIYKRGSSWDFALKRTQPGTNRPTDLTGLSTRIMFRRGSPAGEVVVTLEEGSGATVADPLSGIVAFRVSQIDSAKFADGDVVCFDVEQTNPADLDYAWQSLTYYFSVVEQVTRDA